MLKAALSLVESHFLLSRVGVKALNIKNKDMLLYLAVIYLGTIGYPS